MLIHVTSFFRDPIAFETLSTKVFPHIANQGADVPIRIWVAGCSTGEEAYSIAICLLEYLENQPIKPPIQIYATDLSDRAIDTARAGFYKYSAVADVSPERLGRLFVPVDDRYRIGNSIREMCVFARQNLCSDPPFSKLEGKYFSDSNPTASQQVQSDIVALRDDNQQSSQKSDEDKE